jgi:predicted CoA-binding protein
MHVAILGASPNPERYAHKALLALKNHAHEVSLVNETYDTIDGLRVFKSLKDIQKPVHTITVYVSPKRIAGYIADILAIKPQRVIANPGAESTELRDVLQSAGIKYEESCTLVLLSTNQF